MKILLNDEYNKLIQRENDNYKKISHPFLPKYYGTTQKE